MDQNANWEKAVKFIEKRQKNLFFVVDSALTEIISKIPETAGKYLFFSDRQTNDTEAYYEVVLTMTKRGADKDTLLIAIGGDTVKNLAGFVAATYMQGIDWVYEPTTTTGMLNGTVGGRNRLMFEGKPGPIGTDYPPQKILENYELIKTQPKSVANGGLSTIIRLSMLSKKLFTFVKAHQTELFSYDIEALRETITLARKVMKTKLKTSKKSLKIGGVVGQALWECDEGRRNFGEYLLFGTILENYLFKANVKRKFDNEIMQLVDKIDVESLAFSVENTVKACFDDSKDGFVKIPVAINFGRVTQMKTDQATMLALFNKFKS